MAKNTGKDYRIGEVKNRSQFFNQSNERFTERNTENGQFTNVKSDDEKFKGVRMEKDDKGEKDDK